MNNTAPAAPASLPQGRPGTSENRAWLLAAADRLESEGEPQLAAEARAEAAATTITVPAAARTRCDDCGRPVGTSRMPADWALDWWSHALNGRPCRH